MLPFSLLRGRGPNSYCVFEFKTLDPKVKSPCLDQLLTRRLHESINSVIPKIASHRSHVYRNGVDLVFKVDHDLFDGQRALSMVTMALLSTSTSLPPLTLEYAITQNEYKEMNFDRKLIVELARRQGKSVAQFITNRLCRMMFEESTCRVIVSFAKDFDGEFDAGNHFFPVTLSQPTLLKISMRDKNSWSTTLQKIAQRSQARTQAESIEKITSDITITSLGDLTEVAGRFRDLGLHEIRIFPENAPQCPWVISVYSVGNLLKLISSGVPHLSSESIAQIIGNCMEVAYESH
jgi:hypothetical protein